MNATTPTGAQLAEEAHSSDSGAAETARVYAQNAVNAAGERVRDLRRDMEPAIDQIASRVQEAVQRGLRSASETGARAQRGLEQAANTTSRYIAEQPMRSVLYAAAAGAAVAALVMMTSRRRD